MGASMLLDYTEKYLVYRKYLVCAFILYLILYDLYRFDI